MPRKVLRLPDNIEYLSILDENGRLDDELVPDIPPEKLTKLWRYMVLGRKFDKRMLDLQRQGRIGTFPPITGQEAAQLGSIAALRTSDWLVPAFRETVAEIWRGRPLESVLLAYNGFGEGGYVSNDRNDFPVSIPVGSQMLHAVGVGWGMVYRETEDVVMTFFGDGATSQGDFHEALNFAGVLQAPVVFVCQNNQWAISIPREKQTRSQTLAQKAVAYGFPGIQVDGNDILAVYSAAQEAVARARAGQGPTLIECLTYRVMMHTTADDPKRYRSDEEVAAWQKRDPVIRFETYLLNKGVISEQQRSEVGQEIEAEIQGAVDRAEEQMQQEADPLEMFDHVYVEMPEHLKAQKEALARELARRRGGLEGGA